MHREKSERSVAKAVTYRVISIIVDSSVAYLVTQSAEKTLIFVIISNMISIMIYFFHERAWNRVHWGKHIIVKK